MHTDFHDRIRSEAMSAARERLADGDSLAGSVILVIESGGKGGFELVGEILRADGHEQGEIRRFIETLRLAAATSTGDTPLFSIWITTGRVQQMMERHGANPKFREWISAPFDERAVQCVAMNRDDFISFETIPFSVTDA